MSKRRKKGHLPYRDAANDLGTKSTRSVQRWFRELEHYGFIVKTTGACLGVDGDGIAAHWRLTEYHSYDAKKMHIAPTRDFDRWDGTLFDDPEKKKQNPLPQRVTPRTPKGDILTIQNRPENVRSVPQRGT